ncbi:hypothetical protein KPL35_03925 [Clostridium sp. CF011]|nr:MULTISPECIES: hypothetical protein [unclassified Clostridium]MBU3091218.1 hypothetical protein [Clostridium sp. CF011]MBW9146496.1 hypothetical protein [Clostridium sp. CM027]UVE39621.1 hypothetical protein KTC92_10225 [Clostridium sp. CM027]WAG68528.1 hypothetical protein LL036_10460 [Clostridium sp. CF011]
MENFLLNLGVSKGIIQTIQWWSPALEGIVVIIAIVIVVGIIKHKKNK